MSLFSSTSIAVLSSCDTVMNEARRRFEAGNFPVNASVISRTQSVGRGTHGRTWVSTEGNLYAALRLDAGLMQAGLLAPQLVSACLLRVVKDLGVEAKLKWPNDLVINVPGKGWCKAAGILLECKGELLTAGTGDKPHCSRHARRRSFTGRKSRGDTAGLLSSRSPFLLGKLSARLSCLSQAFPRKTGTGPLGA